MPAITAIPTAYSGVTFRSRSAARFAQVGFLINMRLRLLPLLALSLCAADISPRLAADMADIIYHIEGGARARKPYGVISVQILDAHHAREITLASIRANWRRWEAAGRPGTFGQYMAHRWVPASVDAAGHRRWVRNFNAHLRARSIQAARQPTPP
jgi:hypothetical protein